MPNTLQTFLAAATLKASGDLVAALMRLPADKRGWKPADTARTALDQVAECAVLSGYTAELIRSHQWPISNYNAYSEEKGRAAGGELSDLQALLEASTRQVIEAIQATPDDALETEIQMPWGKMSLAQVLAYAYWNMSYHEGQINYIGSLLG